MKKGRRISKREESRRKRRRVWPLSISGDSIQVSPVVWGILLLMILHLVFYQSLVFQRKTFASPDTIQAAAPAHQYRDSYRDTYDAEPRWIPHVFSGMPAQGSMMLPAEYPPHAVFRFFLGELYEAKVIHHLLGSIWMFLLLRGWGIGILGAWLGGASFSLSTYMVSITAADHGGKLYSASYIPLILLVGERMLRRSSWMWTGLAGLTIGLMLRAKHPQIAYYGLFAITLLFLFALPRIRRNHGYWGMGQSLARLGAALALGFLIATPLLLPAREYAPFSIRGAGPGGGLSYEYATQWSFHPAESITLLVPGFLGFGGSSYWGHMPFTEAPNYFGVVIFGLAVLGAVATARCLETRYLLTLMVLSWLVSLGKHFPILYNLLFDHFPQFNRFRVPVLILILFQTGLVALAARGIHLLSDPQRRLAKRWAIALVAVGIVLLILAASASSIVGSAVRPGEEDLPARVASAIHAEREGHLAKDSVRSAAFLVAAGLLVLAFPRLRLSTRWILPTLLTLLAVADLWGVSARLVHPRASREDVRRVLRATPVEKWLTAQDDLFRILPLGDKARSNRFMAHNISSVMGYYPAKMARYDQLIQRRGLENMAVLRMLNSKYILAPGRLRTDQLREVGTFGSEYLYEIPGSLPRAWFVADWEVVSETEALDRVLVPTFRPDSSALLEIDPAIQVGGQARVINITQLTPERIEVAVDVPGDALLVLSEIFYEPGWRALVDERKAEVLRADYLLCAAVVPEGSRKVTFYYESHAEKMSQMMSICGWVLVIAVFMVGALRRALAGGGLGTYLKDVTDRLSSRST